MAKTNTNGEEQKIFTGGQPAEVIGLAEVQQFLGRWFERYNLFVQTNGYDNERNMQAFIEVVWQSPWDFPYFSQHNEHLCPRSRSTC